MIKKLSAPTNNRSESVELILRGAKKRRVMAYANAIEMNSNAGIKANIASVK